ncbi:MAG: hypothetical protein K2H09_07330 [Treponemataceae bacterium]|nr:hypothetical protein [Treponemataceae bacterium]
MKKMLLVLAGMACLGALASCKNDAEEVTIRYADDMFSQEDDYRYSYVGDVSGNVVYTYNNSSYSTYSASIDSNSLAVIKYDGDDYYSEKSNAKKYTLTVPVLLTQSSVGYDGTTTVVTSPRSVSMYFSKVGSEYYMGSVDSSLGEKISVSGSPESSEFTLTGISSDSYVFSSITFRRK